MPHKVLLVEDEVLLAENEAQTLERAGYEVEKAYSGEAAIEIVDSDPELNLVLMDIDLGKGIDGAETAKKILKKHNLPIVFLSSHTDPEVVNRTKGITSYGYVVKNNGEPVLLTSVKLALDLFEAQSKVHDLYEKASHGYHSLDKDGVVVRTTPVPLESTADRDAARNYTMSRSPILDISDHEQVKERAQSIEWMGSPKTTKQEEYIPEYGDLCRPNKDGLILHSVGKEQLKTIASDYLDLLESSTAIYEKNGDYALGIFSSGWCRLMDNASRRLYTTEDNQKALESGKWLCHESCWEDALSSMKKGKPVEIKCNGGIKMYAVPIRANGEVVGAMNFGYGNPPTNKAELKRISEIYAIPIEELRKQAEAYKPRPQFIIDYAKKRIQNASRTLGYIIERKLSEEAFNRERTFLTSVLNSIEETIIICDEEGRIHRFNEAAHRLHGVSEKPVPSEQWTEYYDLYRIDGETPLPTEEIPLFRALEGEHVHNAEIVVKPKNKSPRLFSCNGEQLIDDAGNIIGAVIAMHDITEYKQVEENLRKALREKDFLMSELNHRVKNNLAIVSSLISLKDSETADDLSDLKRRIDTIKLVHKKLNQHNMVDRIYISEYFQNLLESIFSYTENRNVHIVNHTEDISIGTKLAISLGMVVNEIATNAMKYGFIDGEKALFSVEMSRDSENKQYILTLSNTGNPFPEDKGLENPETMGLQLVSSLVSQIDGSIELRKNPIPTFTIRFPLEE